MAKIDRVEDLPEWFDLEKYQGCESFGAAEWLEQLDRRRDLLTLHPDYNSRVVQDDSSAWLEFVLDFWRSAVLEPARAVREEPIGSPSKGKFRDWMSHASNQPIRPVVVMDLFWQADRDHAAESVGLAAKGISRRWNAINGYKISDLAEHANTPLSINYYDNEGRHCGGGNTEIPIVQVDLAASDAVLKEAFSMWLKGARSTHKPVSTKRTKPLYDRWMRYGLLPYVDLLIWGMETNSHIPDRVMSSAISRYDAGEANLRKTIAPLGANLMRDLSEIQALAAVEAATRAQDKLESSKD